MSMCGVRRTWCVSALLLTMSGGWSGEASAQPTIGTCPVLPADNIWNTPVDTLPVLANSATMVNTIGASRGFHADFGAGTWDGGPIGIPFVTVTGAQTKYPASFLYSDESDPGPYAVPLNAPIEGGANATGDRHAIAIDTANCILYELYRAFPQASSWTADSGAIFDLRSNALRPLTWTSADAAGLPIAPGLVTVDEVLSGEIRHAIRWYYRMGRRVWIHELISFFFRDSLRLDGRTVSHHLGQPQDHEEEASRVGRRERSLQSAAGSVAG